MDVLCLHTGGRAAVGIVKKYDPYDHKWYYYIGTGLPGSFSEAADIQYILDWGQRYSSLDFISDFQETKEDPQ